MKFRLCFFALLLVMMAACDKEDTVDPGTTNDPAELVEANMEIARSFMDYWDSHDMDGLTELFSAQGVYEEVCNLREYTGREAIKAYGAATLSGIPDTRFTVNSITANATMAVVEWTWTGTNSVGWPGMGIPATGAEMELRGISVMQILNGKIVENRDYWDWNTFIKEIGLG